MIEMVTRSWSCGAEVLALLTVPHTTATEVLAAGAPSVTGVSVMQIIIIIIVEFNLRAPTKVIVSSICNANTSEQRQTRYFVYCVTGVPSTEIDKVRFESLYFMNLF